MFFQTNKRKVRRNKEAPDTYNQCRSLSNDKDNSQEHDDSES